MVTGSADAWNSPGLSDTRLNLPRVSILITHHPQHKTSHERNDPELSLPFPEGTRRQYIVPFDKCNQALGAPDHRAKPCCAEQVISNPVSSRQAWRTGEVTLPIQKIDRWKTANVPTLFAWVVTSAVGDGTRVVAKQLVQKREKLTRRRRWEQADEDAAYSAQQLDDSLSRRFTPAKRNGRSAEKCESGRGKPHSGPNIRNIIGRWGDAEKRPFQAPTRQLRRLPVGRIANPSDDLCAAGVSLAWQCSRDGRTTKAGLARIRGASLHRVA